MALSVVREGLRSTLDILGHKVDRLCRAKLAGCLLHVLARRGCAIPLVPKFRTHRLDWATSEAMELGLCAWEEVGKRLDLDPAMAGAVMDVAVISAGWRAGFGARSQ